MSCSLYGSHVKDSCEGSEIEGVETDWKSVPITEARNRGSEQRQRHRKRGIGYERDLKG